MLCPKCEVSLMHEREKGDVILDVCRECGGIWLDRGELERLLGQAMDAGARRARTRAMPERPGDDYRDERRHDTAWTDAESYISKKHAKKLAKKLDKERYKAKKKKKKNLYDLIEDIFD